MISEDAGSHLNTRITNPKEAKKKRGSSGTVARWGVKEAHGGVVVTHWGVMVAH
jgi:hypothetical protein